MIDRHLYALGTCRIDCTAPGAKRNTNYGLWVITMCRCWSSVATSVPFWPVCGCGGRGARFGARDTRRVSALLDFAAKLKSLIKMKTPDFNEKPRQKHAVYLKNSLLSTYGVYILEKEFKKKKRKKNWLIVFIIKQKKNLITLNAVKLLSKCNTYCLFKSA